MTGYVPPAEGEGVWATVAPADAGLTDDGVATIESLIGARNSTAWLLLHDGRIVAEQYWGGADDATTRDVASCQKSVVSTMIGIARAKRLLDLDQPVSDLLGPGWTNAQADEESAITVLHLLTMTSGLDERSLTVAEPAGTRWVYNTDAYQKLRLVLEAVTGTPIDDLSRAWILAAAGASAAARWELRPNAGVDAVGEPRWGLNLTVRDMGRFGLLAMHRGEWGTTRVAPAEWFDEAWTPIPQRRDYGYLWWLFGRGRYRRFGAPEDMVAALGAQDQKIYVIPSAKIVIARQGDAADRISEAESDFDVELVKALRDAVAT
jgi:CubicO group peptidase (beta-lactamase class C family)